MAPRPELYPLQTPKHITFPSELQDLRPRSTEPARCLDGKGPSVPPPVAYTEFLKALSPAFGSPPEYAYSAYPSSSLPLKQLPSPDSLPSTASTASSFPLDTVKPSKTHKRSRSGPPSAMSTPRSAVGSSQFRHLRAAPYSATGVVDSPKSACAHPVRSPYPLSGRTRFMESPASAGGRAITIQQIVTHTVTLKRVPSLAPPPKGKRRRTQQARK